MPDRGRSDAGHERPRAAKPVASPGASGADHFHHGVPRRERPQAGAGRGGDLLPDQAFRRTNPYQIPRPSAGTGWRELAGVFPAPGSVTIVIFGPAEPVRKPKYTPLKPIRRLSQPP